MSGGYPRIEDYALIGDTHSAGLVSRHGSIDWLCLPRFDSPSSFGAILDRDAGGHWSISPVTPPHKIERSYRGETMILETTFECEEGDATLIDCLAVEGDPAEPTGPYPGDVVVRCVKGLRGRVPMKMTFSPRFDYGHITPWFRRSDAGAEAIGGPDALDLSASGATLAVGDGSITADLEVGEGDELWFAAAYRPSHLPPQPDSVVEPGELLSRTERFWSGWSRRCSYEGGDRQQIMRSLLTLKALTYSPTGGIVAAPTTSLPEALGGDRNWDYRYCWLRDATFTLEVLLEHGYTSEAAAWREWLLRAVAGHPGDLQIMYGVRGERRLQEYEVEWLEGYECSSPVRIGNGAVDQTQLDVYGEVMDSLQVARREGVPVEREGWDLQVGIVDHVCRAWREPDEGIWEVRSGKEHFVHSKVMAWVALDRAIEAIEDFGLEGPLERWKGVRAEIESEVRTRGVDGDRGCFVRSYGSDELDASLLMLPLVGFIEATEPVMVATVDAVIEDLYTDGFVRRYATDRVDDGLSSHEGAFLMCSFWLVDCLYLIGREAQARDLYGRLTELTNDVGLLSEEYDTQEQRLLGNFPQAFSHVALVTSAMTLRGSEASPVLKRGRGRRPGR